MIIQGMLMSVEPIGLLVLATDMHSNFACYHDLLPKEFNCENKWGEFSLIYFVYRAKTMMKCEYRSRAERTNTNTHEESL